MSRAGTVGWAAFHTEKSQPDKSQSCRDPVHNSGNDNKNRPSSVCAPGVGVGRARPTGQSWSSARKQARAAGGAMLRSPRGEPRLWGTWTQLEAGGCAKVAKSREISNPAFSHQRRRVLERTVVPIYSPQLLLILVAESRDADYIRPVRNHFS